MSAAPNTVWTAAPLSELESLAAELAEVTKATRGVLHTSLQTKAEGVVNRLYYLIEQHDNYNEAAGLS